MEFDRLIERTIAIQSIPAPTFDEAARRAYIQSEFEKVGLHNVEVDAVGNLLGCIPGKQKPPLIVSAHLDSVFPQSTPLDTQRLGDRIIGPGIGDNAISLAALVELAIDLRYHELPADVWLIANVGEEGLGNLVGMQEITNRFGDRVSAYIVLEGMALGQIYTAGLPVKRYRLTVTSRGGHAWIHAGRRSAIHTVLEVGSRLTELTLPQHVRTSLNIGKIEGGISINSIASQAHLDIDLRSENETTLMALEQEVIQCIEDQVYVDAEMKFEQIGARPAGMLAADHPLRSIAIDAIRSVGEPRIEISTGSTDANIPLSLGYPAICIGLTYGGGAHTEDEFIELGPISRGYRALMDIIQNVLELE